MSYMRGAYYVWRSENRTHFWASDGYDGWDETGWAEKPAPDSRPSGVALPQEVADAYVMLRLAQLVREGRVATAAAEGLERGGGNFGAKDLTELGAAIVAALAPLRGEPNP
jgi:hypothetical protein